MKKLLIIIICLLFIVGCSKTYKDIDDKSKNDDFVLSKVDESKGYYYFEDVYKSTLNGKEYDLKLLKINLNSIDVNNVNFEINTLINQCYKKLKIENNVVIEGNVIQYKVYEYDNVLSIILTSDYYIGNQVENDKYYVYVIDLSNGKILDNEDILDRYDMNNEELFSKLESSIKSDDILFTLSNIKNNGYGLYVSNDNKLGIVYNEIDNNENKRKELVLN